MSYTHLIKVLHPTTFFPPFSLASTRRPIRMLVAPHNTTAMDGQTVMLECLADGNPMPTISWQRAGTS